jgi:hypothetical protein
MNLAHHLLRAASYGKIVRAEPRTLLRESSGRLAPMD